MAHQGAFVSEAGLELNSDTFNTLTTRQSCYIQQAKYESNSLGVEQLGQIDCVVK
jgi:hypothetical protein